MSAALRISSKENPVWLLWLILGITFILIASAIAAWIWMMRPIQFTERDVYGTWVSDSPQPTTLELKKGGAAVISGAPLPQPPEAKHRPLSGESSWQFLSGDGYPSVDLGHTYGQSIYAENGWFSTDLVLFIGDPDSPGSRVVFRHTSSPGNQT